MVLEQKVAVVTGVSRAIGAALVNATAAATEEWSHMQIDALHPLNHVG